MSAVPDRDELENQSQRSKGQKGPPEILQSILVVNVADIAKPKRDAGQAQGKRKADDGYEPSNRQRGIEELVTRHHFPADLQMKSQRSTEHPDDNRPSSEKQEGATDCTDAAGLHIIWGDFVETLIWLGGLRDDEGKLGRALLVPRPLTVAE